MRDLSIGTYSGEANEKKASMLAQTRLAVLGTQCNSLRRLRLGFSAPGLIDAQVAALATLTRLTCLEVRKGLQCHSCTVSIRPADHA